jgi:hypothetical protein
MSQPTQYFVFWQEEEPMIDRADLYVYEAEPAARRHYESLKKRQDHSLLLLIEGRVIEQEEGPKG